MYNTIHLEYNFFILFLHILENKESESTVVIIWEERETIKSFLIKYSVKLIIYCDVFWIVNRKNRFLC